MSRLVTYQFVIALWRAKNSRIRRREVLRDDVNKIINAGFSVGWVSALHGYGRTVWTVDAHRVGKRFVVRGDEKLTAFLELERAICEFEVDLTS